MEGYNNIDHTDFKKVLKKVENNLIKQDLIPQNSFNKVLTYDGFLLNALIKVTNKQEKDNKEIASAMRKALVKQFNKKSHMLQMLSEAELLNHWTEEKIFWEFVPNLSNN